MKVEELFRKLTAFDPDDDVYLLMPSGQLVLIDAVGLADLGIILEGNPNV